MLRYLYFLLPVLLTGLSMCKPDEAPQKETEQAADTASVEDQETKGFDELSSDYYAAQSRVIWQKPDLVINLLGNLRGKTVADIGAGTGFFAFRIANTGAKVIAVDIDPRAIAWMENEKKRYPADVQALLETRLATPSDPGLRTAEVDVVLMVNTYIYLENRIEYFRNLREGLKNKARIIIIDFKAQETPIGPATEERIPSQQVEVELTKAGYTVLSTDNQSLEYQYVIIVEAQ